MQDYNSYALKLHGYFKRHLQDHPEWTPAADLTRLWRIELSKASHDLESVEAIGLAAQALDAGGTAVEELRIMIARWVREMRG